MCSRNSKNQSNHATFLVVFIHFERDEKKEAKRRRLNNASLWTVSEPESAFKKLEPGISGLGYMKVNEVRTY